MNLSWWIALAGLLLAFSLIGLPRYGLIALWRQVQVQRQRVWREDTLKHLYQFEEAGHTPTLQSLAGVLSVSLDRAAAIAADLEAHALIDVMHGNLHLTPDGREYALQVVRAHRLWERYLAEKTGYEQAVWHRKAEVQEHRLKPEDADALASSLGHPRYDPHGDPIPTANGKIVSPNWQALSSLAPEQNAKIVHLEDEPTQVYEQLTQAGLYVGMPVRVLESGPQGVRFQSDGQVRTLTHTQAGSVSVSPLAEAPRSPAGMCSLADIPLGEQTLIERISPACQGPERRRLLDLGFVPGTKVQVFMQSPGGADLRAYQVRGSLIALRRNQAALVMACPVGSEQQSSDQMPTDSRQVVRC